MRGFCVWLAHNKNSNIFICREHKNFRPNAGERRATQKKVPFSRHGLSYLSIVCSVKGCLLKGWKDDRFLPLYCFPFVVSSLYCRLLLYYGCSCTTIFLVYAKVSAILLTCIVFAEIHGPYKCAVHVHTVEYTRLQTEDAHWRHVLFHIVNKFPCNLIHYFAFILFVVSFSPSCSVKCFFVDSNAFCRLSISVRINFDFI